MCIFEAVKYNDIDRIKLLLDYGANVNEKNNYNENNYYIHIFLYK